MQLEIEKIEITESDRNFRLWNAAIFLAKKVKAKMAKQGKVNKAELLRELLTKYADED